MRLGGQEGEREDWGAEMDRGQQSGFHPDPRVLNKKMT